MNAGVIGGRSQRGKWRMNARFHRRQLADRVRAIGSMKRAISVTRCDALTFLTSLNADSEPRLTYLDPPYYVKGQELYPNCYAAADHERIARLLRTFRQPWIMTYDDCTEVRELYKRTVALPSELSYSAREVRRGRELVIFGGGLRAVRASAIRRPTRGFSLVEET
jgi:DNA adenine methylase